MLHTNLKKGKLDMSIMGSSAIMYSFFKSALKTVKNYQLEDKKSINVNKSLLNQHVSIKKDCDQKFKTQNQLDIKKLSSSAYNREFDEYLKFSIDIKNYK